MGDFERYIVEEWAEDYRDGRLNRREFLRRVALMAGGTAVALPVLRQLGVGATLEEVSAATAQTPAVVAQAAGVTGPPDDPSLESGKGTFPMGAGAVSAHLGRPEVRGPAPGGLVIHENRGLLGHF